jgi:hypothetical protein
MCGHGAQGNGMLIELDPTSLKVSFSVVVVVVRVFFV